MHIALGRKKTRIHAPARPRHLCPPHCSTHTAAEDRCTKDAGNGSQSTTAVPHFGYFDRDNGSDGENRHYRCDSHSHSASRATPRDPSQRVVQPLCVVGRVALLMHGTCRGIVVWYRRELCMHDCVSLGALQIQQCPLPVLVGRGCSRLGQ